MNKIMPVSTSITNNPFCAWKKHIESFKETHSEDISLTQEIICVEDEIDERIKSLYWVGWRMPDTGIFHNLVCPVSLVYRYR